MDEQNDSLEEQSDTFENEVFELRGNSISDWLRSIIKLLSASRLIENNAKKIKNENPFKRWNKPLPTSHFALDTGFMLKGYALECFFKAIWLSMGKKLVENGKYKGIPDVHQHDLIQLIRKLDLKIFNKSEELFINTLTKYSTAYGRYPIPTKPDRESKTNIPDNHFEDFIQIIKKVADEITKYPAFDKKIHDKYLKCIIGLVSKTTMNLDFKSYMEYLNELF